MHHNGQLLDSALRSVFGLALVVGTLAAGVEPAEADITLPPITIGAGLISNFYDCDKGCINSPGTIPPGDSNVDGFALESMRFYMNGAVTDQIKFTFNTEYTGSTSDTLIVMDAIGRFEFSDTFNIWAGRFLEPGDRANLSGPYYSQDIAPFADGVGDFYPGVAVGRDNGIAYWGQFGILKVQAGVFDGESLKGDFVNDNSRVLSAARLTLDFWDPEPGYYINGTYYGEKDILSVGAAAQNQNSKTAWNLDGLMEKKLPNLGVINVQAEYIKDNGLTAATSLNGWNALVSYLFPQVIGIGKFQLLGKYGQKTEDASATVQSFKTKTTEINVNYIIKGFNARVGVYFLNQSDDLIDTATKKEYGLNLQLQI
jgi:hypothetical protein